MARCIILTIASLLAAVGVSSPGSATIRCYLDARGEQRFPRASLYVENNTTVPLEVSALWQVPAGYTVDLLPRRTIEPLKSQSFLYAVGVGRNVVNLKIVVDSNIYEVTQDVLVNNLLDETCRRTYRVIVTNRTFPGAIIGSEPRPVTARFIGCFADNDRAAASGVAGRDLDGDVWSHPAMTVNACVARCRQGSYAFAGVQFRTWCFCGNQHGRHGASSACNMPCAGNPREFCGGKWANSIYALE